MQTEASERGREAIHKKKRRNKVAIIAYGFESDLKVASYLRFTS